MDIYRNYINIGLGAGIQSEAKIKQFEKNYSRFFPKDKEASILDIGPGKAEMLTCLSKNGFSDIQAVDISASVIDFVKGLGYKAFLTDNLTNFLHENTQQYSLITMCDVIEHISKSQIIDIMSAVRNVLHDDGFLIVQIPNMQSITSNIFLYDDFTHETGYTERSLIQMLTLSGFSSIECYGFDFLDNSFKSRVQYVLRNLLWFFVRIARNINGTMPHKILNPVFFAVVKK